MGLRLRILGLDIEAKRKGSDWSTGTFNFREMICAAMRYDEEGAKHSFLPFDFTTKQLERWAAPLRDPLTVVVAHNAMYDVPGVHGTLVAAGLDGLEAVWVCDTLKHGPKAGGWMRRDLASMAARYGVVAKGSISTAEWDLAHEGNVEMRDRVRDYNQNDVSVVLELRRAMLAKDHLSAPRLWRP